MVVQALKVSRQFSVGVTMTSIQTFMKWGHLCDLVTWPWVTWVWDFHNICERDAWLVLSVPKTAALSDNLEEKPSGLSMLPPPIRSKVKNTCFSKHRASTGTYGDSRGGIFIFQRRIVTRITSAAWAGGVRSPLPAPPSDRNWQPCWQRAAAQYRGPPRGGHSCVNGDIQKWQ